MTSTRVVAITGATGYVGSLLVDRFRRAGWEPVALCRRQPSDASLTWRHFDLAEPITSSQLDGIDALIHCAYDMTARTPAEIWSRNVEPTGHLVRAAQGLVPRTIVVSSMSAYDGTHQLYGSAKLAIERESLAAGAVVVRPGLVYGTGGGGMFGALMRLVRLPVVPVVSGHQFTVHEDDLAGAMIALADSRDPWSEPICVAHPEAVSFKQILREIAREQGRICRLVPVNWQLLYSMARLLERARLDLPVRADSLIGLVRPATSADTGGALRSLHVELRPFSLQGFEMSSSEQMRRSSYDA